MTKTKVLFGGMLVGASALFFGCSDSGSDDAPGDGDLSGDGDTSGDGDGTMGDGDGDGVTGDGDGDAAPSGDPLHGEFIVTLTAANESTGNDAFASFQGNVRTRAVVGSVEWEFVREEGECELYVPVFPFCDPQCETGEICVAGDVCEPEPQAVNIGDITVSGLATEEGATEFSISPLGSKSNYLLSASNTLSYPPADDGAPVTLTASIDESPVVIEAAGIAPLSVEAEEIAIGGEDTTVTWSPPTDNATSAMEIILEISHHGGVKGEVRCMTEDDGEHTIPGSIQDDLIDLGVAGFPTVTFLRVARGHSKEPHQIEFRVQQAAEVPVTIDGLVSCSSDDDCSDGETCQVNRSCG